MQKIICTCGHPPETHDEEGMCFIRGCSCEMFRLLREEVNVYDRLHYESGYYIQELKRACCNQCKKVMACAIVATALKVKKGQFIASLVIGFGNLLQCKEFSPLPTTNREKTRRSKHLYDGENSLFNETRFESREEYALRHAK